MSIRYPVSHQKFTDLLLSGDQGDYCVEPYYQACAITTILDAPVREGKSKTLRVARTFAGVVQNKRKRIGIDNEVLEVHVLSHDEWDTEAMPAHQNGMYETTVVASRESSIIKGSRKSFNIIGLACESHTDFLRRLRQG